MRNDFREDSDLDVAIEIDGVNGNAQATWMFDTESWRAEIAGLVPFEVDLQHFDGDETPVIKDAISQSSILVYEREGLT
ncbi:hypothetical protein WJ63_07815 [Burkholderia pyrrocinia]|nr:hypothetical protein WJ63_07815 [Burkholderia pyrrocinia]